MGVKRGVGVGGRGVPRSRKRGGGVVASVMFWVRCGAHGAGWHTGRWGGTGRFGRKGVERGGAVERGMAVE